MKIWCYKCNKELQVAGGLLFSPPDANEEVSLFSPPDANEEVRKFHLCVDCYSELEKWMRGFLDDSQQWS